MILATGARARTISAIGLEPDGERVWTYREALVPKSAPKSLVVVGSGAIGMEFASFYRALGSDVTVVEMLPRILPVEDEEVSKAAHKAFEKRGLKFRVRANVKKLTKSKAGRLAGDRGRRQGRDPGRPRSPSWPWASSAMSRTWAWRPWA